MIKKEGKKAINFGKLFRNIWLLSILVSVVYFAYVVIRAVDKNMTDSEALNLTIVLSISGMIGGLSFIGWIFLKFSKRIRKILIIFTLVLIIPILIIQLTRTFFYDYPKITGKSMSPSFIDGKRYLVCRYCNDYKRGDVLIYKSPRDGSEHIGRIVGLPTDLIEIYQKNLILNGKKLDEKYADWSEWKSDSKITIKLNEQEYFILTDKRQLDKGEESYFDNLKINTSFLKGKFLR